MTPQQILSTQSPTQRAAALTSQLESLGGRLPPTFASQFVTDMYDASPILQMATRIDMKADRHIVPRMSLNNRILFKSGGDYSTVTDAQKSGLGLGQTELLAEEWRGMVPIPYDLLEDNIQQEELLTTVIGQVAARCGVDLALVGLNGDTSLTLGVSDEQDALATTDGWLKQATSVVVDAGGKNISEDLMASWYEAMPARYLDRNPAAFRFLPSRIIALNWRRLFGARQTPGGDAVSTGPGVPDYAGRPVEGDVNISVTSGVTSGLFCDPSNLLVGIHRDIQIIPWNNVPENAIEIHVRLRAAFGIAQPNAVVKLENVTPLNA